MPKKRKKDAAFSLFPGCYYMPFPQRKRLSALLHKAPLFCTLEREREGEPGPHYPLPDSALNVDPHSPAQVWNSASSPLGCFSASDLDLLLIPGSPSLARVPKPHLVTCSIVV